MAIVSNPRKYTAEDFGACRFIVENGGADQRIVIGETAGTGALTRAMCERLSLLNLLDGALDSYEVGNNVRLAGIGVKTGEEAIRLAIPAIVVIPLAVTFANATDIFTSTPDHLFVEDDMVVLAGTAVPTGFVAGTIYYVIFENLAAKTFMLSITAPGPRQATAFDETTDIFTAVAHGFIEDDRVQLGAGTIPAGFVEGTLYHVIAANLTVDTFQLSLTQGGAAVLGTTDGVDVTSRSAGDTVDGSDDGTAVTASRQPI